MTATQSRGLRRARKLRALRLLSVDTPGDPRRAFADVDSLQEARRAWREWGGLTPILLEVRSDRD